MTSEGARLSEEAKRNYFLKAGKTLADSRTSNKTYWNLINTVLHKVKILIIPFLLENGLFATDITEKVQLAEMASWRAVTNFSLRVHSIG